MAVTRPVLAAGEEGTAYILWVGPSSAERKGTLIFSRNDEESSPEMVFTEIETSETEAGTLLL